MWRNHPEILSPEVVIYRALARRRYNAHRQFRAAYRQREVARLRREGYQSSAIAALLNVCKRTIHRDIAAIDQALRHAVCPTCGHATLTPRSWTSHNPVDEETPHV